MSQGCGCVIDLDVGRASRGSISIVSCVLSFAHLPVVGRFTLLSQHN
jgi:hypothetical protein